MRKTILTAGITMLFVVGSATFIGCGNSENQSKINTNEHVEGEHTEYQCPMKCEGEKTYSEEGSCPVCGMDLTELD